MIMTLHRIRWRTKNVALTGIYKTQLKILISMIMKRKVPAVIALRAFSDM